MEVKSKEKILEKKHQEKFINFETQSIATDLVREMYIHLKKQKGKLTTEQTEWLTKVDDLYGKSKITEGDFICSVLENTYRYLNRTGRWNEVDDRAYEMLEKIIFLKSKGGAFKDFVDKVEQAIRSTLSLDFSNKASLCDEKLDDRNILNYVTFALNMVIEKIETSMVSMKVINAMLEAPPKSAFIVTDVKGDIRFISNVGESLLNIHHNQYLQRSIFTLFQSNQELIQQCIERAAELTDVKVQLQLNDTTIPVLLTAIHANTEEDEITEIVFIIKTREQVERDIKLKEYAKFSQQEKIAPLNSISEMLHLLRSKSKDIDSQHLITFLEESVDIIKKDSKHLHADDLITSSELVNIEFIFDRIVEALRFTEGFNEVTFHKDISYQHDLQSDPVLIYSILQKLITTAINYRRSKGENKIQFTVRDLSDTQIILILHFNGKDIPSESLNNLFEKNVKDLFNIDAKNSEQLSVKEAVHKLHGSIDIYNKPAGDVIFTISLPY